MTVLEQAILATDLASYFEKRDKFKMAADDGEIDWQVNPFHKCFQKLEEGKTDQTLNCSWETHNLYLYFPFVALNVITFIS